MALSNKGGITQDKLNTKYTNLGILINILVGALKPMKNICTHLDKLIKPFSIFTFRPNSPGPLTDP